MEDELEAAKKQVNEQRTDVEQAGSTTTPSHLSGGSDARFCHSCSSAQVGLPRRERVHQQGGRDPASPGTGPCSATLEDFLNSTAA